MRGTSTTHTVGFTNFSVNCKMLTMSNTIQSSLSDPAPFATAFSAG